MKVESRTKKLLLYDVKPISRVNRRSSSEYNLLKRSKGYAKSDKLCIEIIESWLQERKINIDTETISKTDLDQILAKFYLELRKQDGEMYAKTAFRAIHHGIQWKFKEIRKNSAKIKHEKQSIN